MSNKTGMWGVGLLDAKTNDGAEPDDGSNPAVTAAKRRRWGEALCAIAKTMGAFGVTFEEAACIYAKQYGKYDRDFLNSINTGYWPLNEAGLLFRLESSSGSGVFLARRSTQNVLVYVHFAPEFLVEAQVRYRDFFNLKYAEQEDKKVPIGLRRKGIKAQIEAANSKLCEGIPPDANFGPDWNFVFGLKRCAP